jgi:hypothetical protein
MATNNGGSPAFVLMPSLVGSLLATLPPVATHGITGLLTLHQWLSLFPTALAIISSEWTIGTPPIKTHTFRKRVRKVKIMELKQNDKSDVK